MGGGGAFDGRTITITLKGHNIAMKEYHDRFIAQVGDEGEVIQKTFSSTRTRNVVNSDMSKEQKRERVTTHVTRVIDEPGMKRVRMSIGRNFGVGNPTPVPSWKAINESGGTLKAKVPLTTKTEIRMVTTDVQDTDVNQRKERLPYPDLVASAGGVAVNEEERQEELDRLERHKYAKNCRYLGVDIIYTETENGMTAISVRSKFKKLLGISDTVRVVAGYRTRAAVAAALAAARAERDAVRAARAAAEANGTRPPSPPGIMRTVTDNDPIEICDLLKHEGITYEISAINLQTDEVECVRFVRGDEHPRITLTVERATYLVATYN